MASGGFELAFGLALGFSLAVPPGPMNAFIAAQSVRSRRRGTLTGLGAMSADAVLAAVVFLLSSALDLSAYARGLYLVGAVVMAYFGVHLLRTRAETGAAGPSDARTYTTALGIGLSNPFQILWWLTAGLAFAYLGGAVLLVGLFGAIAVWVVAFPIVVRAGAERSPRFAPVVTLVSAGAMIAFAGYFVVLALG